MIIAGCDEAGRGPIIGPMVLATVAIDTKDKEKLAALGVKDSKLLSPKRREALYPLIKEVASHVEISVVGPQEIDSLRGSGTNLNQIEALKIAEMLAKIDPDEAYIDSPHSGYPQRFENVIRSSTIHPLNVDMYCEHKADYKYPIVAAASIIAKVERDRAVQKIKDEIGFEFGSGYIADEITKAFLDRNHQVVDQHIRKSWAPYKALAEKSQQASLTDF
jgi:ribonuclease HII